MVVGGGEFVLHGLSGMGGLVARIEELKVWEKMNLVGIGLPLV